MASLLAGIGGGLLRTIGGGLLTKFAKPALNFLTGAAGKLFKPISALLKPVGNTIAKWTGHDFMRNQFSKVGKWADEKIPSVMQVIPGQSVGDVFKKGLQHHYDKALGIISNKANDLVAGVAGRLSYKVPGGGGDTDMTVQNNGGGYGIEKYSMPSSGNGNSLGGIAGRTAYNLLTIAQGALTYRAYNFGNVGDGAGGSMVGNGQKLFNMMAQGGGR